MPVVNVTLGKRQFQMACAGGEEQRLHDLAASVSTRIAELESQLGSGNDTMLLAMTALMLQDELQDAKAGGGAADDGAAKQRHEQVMINTLDAISDQVVDATSKINAA